ncbi:MAG: hypothetical protein M3503_01835 [Actinomycetota bacterium]|nr:hypothetical protein [Actinomycetota bacterium]
MDPLLTRSGGCPTIDPGRPDWDDLAELDFELADPGHLDSLVSTIRRIDSVYEDHRILPGS